MLHILITNTDFEQHLSSLTNECQFQVQHSSSVENVEQYDIAIIDQPFAQKVPFTTFVIGVASPQNPAQQMCGANLIFRADCSFLTHNIQSVIRFGIARKKISGYLSRMEEELIAKQNSLEGLSNVGVLLASFLDLQQVLTSLMEISLNISEGEVGSIMLWENDELVTKIAWGLDDNIIRKIRYKGHTFSEWAGKKGEILTYTATATPKNEIEIDDPHLRISSLVSVPLKYKEKILGVLSVVNRRDGSPFSDKNIGEITLLAKFASVAIENALLHQESLEKQKIEQELKLAHQFQQSMFPTAPPQIPGVEVFGFCRPAKQVGGDYFDYFPVGKDLATAIGDVSGKGVAAAMFMSITRSIFRNEALKDQPANIVVTNLNNFLLDETEHLNASNIFVTFLYTRFHQMENSLSYVNAGHCLPVIIRQKKVIELQNPHIFLGQFPENYVEYKHDWLVGDLFVAYTDGITEEVDQQENMYLKERLYSLLNQMDHETKSLAEIATCVYDDVIGFHDHQRQTDDITLILVRRNQ